MIAYIANQFPSAVEPYVLDEIEELTHRGSDVLPCSAQPPEQNLTGDRRACPGKTLYLRPFRLAVLVRALWSLLRDFRCFEDLLARILFHGTESPLRRGRALFHTWLGVYYALLLEGRGIEHIHAHHGYYSSWIAMVAARKLRAGFSLTLHGSDLLLHHAYLDTKLKHAAFCLTVSNFNRDYMLMQYPGIPADRIWVQRLGVEVAALAAFEQAEVPRMDEPILLAVGRLHRVKDHAFLLRACRMLEDRGVHALCLIAGDGPERSRLARLVRKLGLEAQVELLGHVPRERLDAYYAIADLVVLTSRSEGIPLTLMEAMAMGRVVLAPAITGIPELVEDHRTGFLYRAGDLEDFVAAVEHIRKSPQVHLPVRQAARARVHALYNRRKNLQSFGDFFLPRIRPEYVSHADPVLQ